MPDSGAAIVHGNKSRQGKGNFHEKRVVVLGKQVCIVIPIYKDKMSRYERLSIGLTEKRLCCYDIYFITHRRLNLENYKQYKNIKIVYFPKRYFKNTITYSRLLLKESFYRKFSAYKYMLIVQSDALILNEADALDNIMKKNFDFWGAMWETPVEICSFEIEKSIKNKFMKICPVCLQKQIFRNPIKCYVGNGGLSLRNINKTIELLREKKLYAEFWFDNEDKFFAYHGLLNHVGYRIAPKDLVDQFSLESRIRYLETIKPFGLHGWDRIGHSYVLRYLKKINILQ